MRIACDYMLRDGEWVAIATYQLWDDGGPVVPETFARREVDSCGIGDGANGDPEGEGEDPPQPEGEQETGTISDPEGPSGEEPSGGETGPPAGEGEAGEWGCSVVVEGVLFTGYCHAITDECILYTFNGEPVEVVHEPDGTRTFFWVTGEAGEMLIQIEGWEIDRVPSGVYCSGVTGEAITVGPGMFNSLRQRILETESMTVLGEILTDRTTESTSWGYTWALDLNIGAEKQSSNRVFEVDLREIPELPGWIRQANYRLLQLTLSMLVLFGTVKAFIRGGSTVSD